MGRVMEQKVAVYCLKYAQSTLPERMVYADGDWEKRIPISFAIYCIRWGGRNILVDAGCDTMPGFEMEWLSSPADVLKEAGLTAKEITDVILTHAHHDHIDAVRHFENAVVHITNTEYEKGKSYIPERFSVNTFETELVISPELRAVLWGGHASGSAIVELKQGDTIHVFAGDECYTAANLTQGKPTGACANPEKAEAFIQVYSKKPYIVHTCHDISLKTERII